jgi:hypothetical protein
MGWAEAMINEETYTPVPSSQEEIETGEQTRFENTQAESTIR